MYKKLLKIFVLCVLVGVIFFPDSSFAFKSITRDQLIYDAIEFSPEGLKGYLRENLAAVSSGNHFAERHQRRSYSVDPYATESIYKQLVKDLKSNKLDEFNTAHAFGVIACFLAETISPDNYKTPQHLIPKKVTYDGYQEIGDINSHITGLIKNYRIPCRQRLTKEVTVLLYNVAVNEIIDYWISAWESSGREPGMLASAGENISHENLVLNLKAVG
jgi:hypothetical protein